MRIVIRLFGPAARAVGGGEIAVQCEGVPTPALLRTRLVADAPALAPLLAASRFAVNHEFADESRAISDRDEVALIGMVSGG